MKTQQVLRRIFAILEYGNPFEEEEQNLVHITSRLGAGVLGDVATKAVKEAKRIGEDQYTAFINERLIIDVLHFTIC